MSDSLWLMIEPLLLPALSKSKGGRPHVPARAALIGILFVLRTGIPWEMLPPEMGCGSGVARWRRLRDWQRGVAESAPRATLPTAGRRPHPLGPSLMDSSSIMAKKGGAATGPNPTDRGRPSTERQLIADRRGIPLAFLLTGANIHDSIPVENLLDAAPPLADKPGRPRSGPAKRHADKAYDHRRCRRAWLRRRRNHVSPGAASRQVRSSAAIDR